ncbi:hypothetical protein ETB97_007318 [Aspergillus alliaceus]|uniref:BZIP domain-containing protein n=1 Tax=Petromyces alliaceus TaxID=209559 RepID=A0A5N7BTP6_PETAA|nr:uncharacterized protein BDW43DRAFT_57740 [Aspergillus alliaceus]KAB8234583.1 hypothetical protein BDW43DRAFT_57740 [Aspergillus alliaceus]KAE8385119.1 hypothetical protein BDV23DRAFT_24943 [Aspergillus alliaceus]KAF5856457.1 hypothetical protein ETB97_007318 [Aspergillus burnettii]
MSAGGSLYSRASLGMADPSGAGPLGGPFAPLPEQNSLWAFSGSMASWQGVPNNNLDMEQFQNSHVRNGQPTPPQYVDAMEEMYPLAQYSLADSPPELAHQKQRGSLSDQSQSQPNTYSLGPRRRRAPDTGRNQPEQNEKRKKFLERNRVAASKCRLKKKEQTKLLQAQYQELNNKRNELKRQTERLRSEKLSLKNLILAHANCGDQAINLRIQQMVEDITSQDTPRLGSIQSPQPNSPSTPQGLSFGFDGPMQLSPSSAMESPEDQQRRESEQFMTESSYGLCADDSFDDLIQFN